VAKVTVDPQTLIYPMPVVLVGTKVNQRPNFMAAAWCSPVASQPAMVAVSVRRNRYTYEGIRQNRAFSVNLPTTAMVRETDYCGITHGNETNKADVCGFKVFYGGLDSAPLIEQCPVNLACTVAHELELGLHTLFIGRVEEARVSEECLSEGRPDAGKIALLAFVASPVPRYYALGSVVGRAFSVGKDLSASRSRGLAAGLPRLASQTNIHAAPPLIWLPPKPDRATTAAISAGV